MKKNPVGLIAWSAFVLFSVLGLALVTTAHAEGDPSLTANQTVANATLGVANQVNAVGTTTTNTAQIKATRTLTVVTPPTTTQTFTIGTCAVTFATTTNNVPAQDLDCTGGATITTSTTTNDIAKTATEIATAIKSLTNILDTGRPGGVTVTASTTSATSAVFTTTATETAATAISYTAGTAGLTMATTTTGVIPVAQVNTLTPANVEIGDTFSTVVNGTTYSFIATAGTVQNVVEGLQPLVDANASVVCTEDDTKVTCTAATAGTGFTISGSTVNRAAAAQIVTFTPANPSPNYRFTIILDGANYASAKKSTVKDIVEELTGQLTAATLATCTEDDAVITCTANTVGTGFSYSTDVRASSSGSGSGSGGGGGSSHSSGSTASHTTVSSPEPSASAAPSLSPSAIISNISISPMQTLTFAPKGASTIARLLQVGATGADVTTLQTLLASDPSLYPQGIISGYFGNLTLAAVQKFQEKYSIASKGTAGYGWVGPRTRAKLVEIFGR